MKRLLIAVLVLSPCVAFAQVPSCEESLAAFRQYANDLRTSRDSLEGQLSELRVSSRKSQDELQAVKAKEVKQDDAKKVK